MMGAVFAGTWQREKLDPDLVAGEAVQLAANWIVLDAALAALDSGKLHAPVAAELRARLIGWQAWLAEHAGRGKSVNDVVKKRR